MTSTRHSGRSPMSMVSCLSRECSDQAAASEGMHVPSSWPGLSRPSTPCLLASKADVDAGQGGGTYRQLWLSAFSAKALQTAAARLAFPQFWPKISAGRLAGDEPLAN